jgi:LacI family transcriptional regulator
VDPCITILGWWEPRGLHALGEGVRDWFQRQGRIVRVCCATDAATARRTDPQAVILAGGTARLPGMPTVAIDPALPGADAVVAVDDDAIGRLGAEHLLARGATSLAFLGYRGQPWSERRLAGFRARAGSTPCRRIDAGERHLAWQQPLSASLRRGVAALPPGTGLMAANDYLAARALRLAHAMGRRLPDDLKVLGVDDRYPADTGGITLSSIPLPLRALGETAARFLDDLLAGRSISRQTILLPPIGVSERASTATSADEVAFRAIANSWRDEPGLSVAALARDARLSVRSLERLFHRYARLSPLAWRRRLRLEVGLELLERGTCSITDAALAAGYASASAFHRACRAELGRTPGSVIRSA